MRDHLFKLLTSAALFAFLAVFACAGPDATDSNTAGGAPAGFEPPLTITSMQNGDIACYVDFKDANGKRGSMKAGFDLCDDGLVGKKVTVTTQTATLQSPACEGDPDCTKTVKETIIATIDRI